MKLVRRETTIQAPAESVYRHLTEADGLKRWMVADAVSETVVGGTVRWIYENGAVMVGRYLELVPPRRIVFSYGWEDGRLGLPPASTTVEIDLVEEDGRTTLHLTHHALPPETADEHGGGWDYFLDRLRLLLAR